MNKYAALVKQLEDDADDYERLNPANFKKYYNPLGFCFKIIVGIFAGLLSILWIAHIIIYMVVDAGPFINSYLSFFEQYFALMGTVSVRLLHCKCTSTLDLAAGVCAFIIPAASGDEGEFQIGDAFLPMQGPSYGARKNTAQFVHFQCDVSEVEASRPTRCLCPSCLPYQPCTTLHDPSCAIHL